VSPMDQVLLVHLERQRRPIEIHHVLSKAMFAMTVF
jgi:hypothetical protein